VAERAGAREASVSMINSWERRAQRCFRACATQPS
jgi:hypothetical protein